MPQSAYKIQQVQKLSVENYFGHVAFTRIVWQRSATKTTLGPTRLGHDLSLRE